MVTVIADKDDLSTPVHNGVNNSSNDAERNFSSIKDYQEVDFHRSPSCKPFPEDLQRVLDDQTNKSSIKGSFLVQIDGIEQFSSNTNVNQFPFRSQPLIVTMTDGEVTVKGITEDSIPNLNVNVKVGCKLLLNGVIPIQNGLLHLTAENTRFQYGSSRFPRPRSAYRGRGGSSYRPSYEGRRGNNGNTRYDNENGDTNFFKRPPPKTTLMDFMTTLKISQETKINRDDDNEKVNRRNHPDSSQSSNETDHVLQTTNPSTTSDSNGNEIDPNHSIDPNNAQPASNHEPFDPEDDPSHANFRERRNPLPPRLQRAQEERSRRNTTRFYDESTSIVDGNDEYSKGSLMSSSNSHLRRQDQRSFLANDSSSNLQHPAALHSYATYSAMLPVINSSGQTQYAYFTTSSAPLAYNLTNAPFATQPVPMGPTYGNEAFAFCYGQPYPPFSYLPSPMSNGFHAESKSYGDQGNSTAATTTTDENETTVTNESQVDETNDSENRSQSSTTEPKTNISSSSSSLNDANSFAKQSNNQEKRRDPRPRWKVNDLCWARWSEDREFYVATICEIQPPYCTVFFRDYHNYDQVHFRDLKPLPRDQQQYYPSIVPVPGTSSDLNPLAASAYFTPYADYYAPPIDGCLIMPEAPPFPFNSAGTMYMYPAAIPVGPHPNPLSTYSQPVPRRFENGNLNSNPNSETTINSSSSPSKDSNDTSITDSTATSTDDVHHDESTIPSGKRSAGSTDASPLTLVTSHAEQSVATETKEEEEEKAKTSNQ